MKEKKDMEMPSTQQLEAELQRVKYKSRYRYVLKTAEGEVTPSSGYTIDAPGASRIKPVRIYIDGTVYVNKAPLAEPYLEEKSLGECDIALPFQVPDGRWFVMGDHRATSVDSRSTAVGCVSDEQIVGRRRFGLYGSCRICLS